MATLIECRVNADSTLQKKISRAETGNLLTALALGNKIPEHASEASLDIINKVQALQYTCDNEKILFIAELILWVEDTTLPLPEVEDSLDILFEVHRRQIFKMHNTRWLELARLRISIKIPFSFYKLLGFISDHFINIPQTFSGVNLLLALRLINVNCAYYSLLTLTNALDTFNDTYNITQGLKFFYSKDIVDRFRKKTLKVERIEKQGNIRFSNAKGCVAFHMLLLEVYCKYYSIDVSEIISKKFQHFFRESYLTNPERKYQTFLGEFDNNRIPENNCVTQYDKLLGTIGSLVQIISKKELNDISYAYTKGEIKMACINELLKSSSEDLSSNVKSEILIEYLPSTALFLLIHNSLTSYPKGFWKAMFEGKNIRSVKHFSNILSKKAAHIFHNMDINTIFPKAVNLSLDTIIKYCIIKSYDISDATVLIILQYMVVDFNQNSVNESAYKFWVKVLEFLGRNNDDFSRISDDNQRWVFSYFQHCFDEIPNYSLKGRTLNSIIRLSSHFRDQYQRRPSFAFTLIKRTWVGSEQNGMDFEDHMIDGNHYKIVQLLSTEELIEESNMMSHCVSAYGDRCFIGDCSIWSLREFINGNWMPRVTIEVSKNGHIVQVKGKYNVVPYLQYLNMIRTWAVREKLIFQDLLMN